MQGVIFYWQGVIIITRNFGFCWKMFSSLKHDMILICIQKLQKVNLENVNWSENVGKYDVNWTEVYLNNVNEKLNT